VPAAKAIEYAEQRDFPAVLGYCASSQVARTLVSEYPPFFFAGQLQVTRTGTGKERVELGWEPKYRFDVEVRAGRWQVVARPRAVSPAERPAGSSLARRAVSFPLAAAALAANRTPPTPAWTRIRAIDRSMESITYW